MIEILSWTEIVDRYRGEWVELVHYDWPEELSRPASGSVRVHAADRAEFFSRIHEDAPHIGPYEAVIIYVGEPTKLAGILEDEAALAGQHLFQ